MCYSGKLGRLHGRFTNSDKIKSVQIRLKKLQQAKAAAAAAAAADAEGHGETGGRGGAGAGGSGDHNMQSVAFLRAKKDLQEYEEIPSVTITYERSNPMKVQLSIVPDSGYHVGGRFDFECTIPGEFPNAAPEFRCVQKIYHPNIDMEGHVCLNILRNDWKPTLTLQLVFAGILHLFLQPNPNDPLNKVAANDLAKYPDQFARHVQDAMCGGYIGSNKFDRVVAVKERSYGTGSRYNRAYNNFY